MSEISGCSMEKKKVYLDQSRSFDLLIIINIWIDLDQDKSY